MKARTAIIFTASALLTAGTWLLLYPRKPAVESQLPRPSDALPAKAGHRPSSQAILAELFGAASAEEKLKASQRLSLIPEEEIPALLNQVVADHGRKLDFPLHALLLRWASIDGRAAMDWAWLTWRDDPDWRTAWAGIARSWAWKDPEALGKWVLDCAVVTAPDDYRSLSLEKAQASDTPPLEAIELPAIMKWIAPRCPELVVQILIERKGNSTEDLELWDGFTEPTQFERAAAAFDPALKAFIREEQQTHHLSFGPHQHLRNLLLRWRKSDPASFVRSSFADLFPSEIETPAPPPLPLVSSLPSSERSVAATQSLAGIYSPKLDAALDSIVADWSKSDPQACAAWITTLDDSALAIAAGNFAGNRAPVQPGETLAWIGDLPAGVREKSLVRAFDAWTASHPGESADLTGSGEPLHSQWRDLETLQDTVGGATGP